MSVIKAMRVLAPLGALIAATAPVHATAYYQVTGGYGYGSFYQSPVVDTGVQSMGASAAGGGSDYYGGGSANFSGMATADSLHAAAVAFAYPQNSSRGFAGVSALLHDELTFDYGAGAIASDPIAIRVTLYLDSGVAVALQPGSAQITEDFNPAGNTSYFNTGLQDYNYLQADNTGDTVHTSVARSTAIYYVPIGAAFNFNIQLTASANAAVGYDYGTDRFLGNNAGADASHTGFLGIDILTPGAVLHSASGADYAIAAVPEPATWSMVIAGFGAIGATMRRRQRTAVRFAHV